MKILIDGVFFQLRRSGIGRVWASIIPILAENHDLTIYILDRGGTPDFKGVSKIPFPSYHSRYTAADSELLQHFCDHVGSDLFLSTYYTTPLSTPAIQMIYDMIPEKLNFNLRYRDWQEKALAISFARRHICISNNTRNDLLVYYPELCNAGVEVAHCGVDRTIFSPAEKSKIEVFITKNGLVRRYFIMTGDRSQHLGYKNAKIFFEAVSALSDAEFDILCVGGEREIEQSILQSLPKGVRAMRVSLTDIDLAKAYSGAVALVYPSLYEGFGMPVIEAMACGCPVITTTRGSLREVAAGAAYTIEGESVNEMITAVQTLLNDQSVVGRLRHGGLERAKAFSWKNMAEIVTKGAIELAHKHKAGEFDRFFGQWSKLRRIQSELDVSMDPDR
jgi:glycosyltransferase involved in cell wall biosynthesis